MLDERESARLVSGRRIDNDAPSRVGTRYGCASGAGSPIPRKPRAGATLDGTTLFKRNWRKGDPLKFHMQFCEGGFESERAAIFGGATPRSQIRPAARLLLLDRPQKARQS
jgi:hypothetical protein